MTQFMHTMIAMILLGATWHLVLKQYFIRPEELDFWSEWLDR